MKKITMILVGLAVLVASCTKTEDVKVSSSDRSISFNGYTERHTKAAQTDVTTDNLNSFKVTAVGDGAVYYDDVEYSKKGDVWESNPVHFWPAYNLDFFAYNTPGNNTGFTREITKDGQILVVTPASDLANQEDLVAACAESKNPTDNDSKGAIALNFHHYLTQVVVKAKNSSANYKVVVDGVKLANLAGDGTYTFTDAKMTATTEKINSATSSDYSSTFTEKTLTSAAVEVMTDGGNGRWYLIPQTVTAWNQETEKKNTSNGTYLALKVKITTSNGAKIYPASGDASAWMAVPVPAGLAFVQGKKYNVTVDFYSSDNGGAGYVDPEYPGDLDGKPGTDDSGKKIKEVIMFDASVTTWGDTVDVVISL